MSRSHRKTPIRGVTSAEPEKSDKTAAHRKIRRTVRIAVEQEAPVVPHEKQLSNPWSMAKDGKVLFDPVVDPKLMRK